MHRRLSLVRFSIALLWCAGTLVACAPIQAPADSGAVGQDTAVAETGPNAAPRIFFVEPADGATVTTPVKVVMGAENFVVEAATDTAQDGHGHLHVMVDTACVEVGQGIPKDEAHLHFGKGQLEAELDLAPGEHTLCLQAADGLHVALPGDGMTHTIALTVE